MTTYAAAEDDVSGIGRQFVARLRAEGDEIGLALTLKMDEAPFCNFSVSSNRHVGIVPRAYGVKNFVAREMQGDWTETA